MGDAHFLLQNSLSGVVLFGFILCGIRIFDPSLAEAIAKYVFTNDKIISLLLVTPLLGILVKVTRMLIAKYFQPVAKTFSCFEPSYQDRQRKETANKIRAAVIRRKIPIDDISNRLEHIPDDSLFVWLYYTDAPQHLIEWERRRRDLQHLGENWSVAAILGFIFGMISGSIGLLLSRCEEGKNYTCWINVLFILCSCFLIFVWVKGLTELQRHMKDDADGMNLIWLCSRLDPELKNEILSDKELLTFR